MDFASPVIGNIRHVNTKKERITHISKLKQQQTQNTSEQVQGSKDPLRILLGHYRETPWIAQGCSKDPLRMIQGSSKDTTGKLQGLYKDTLR